MEGGQSSQYSEK